MRISMGSGEFDANRRLHCMLHGISFVPTEYIQRDGYVEAKTPPMTPEMIKAWKESCMPISVEDIKKLNTWDNYKEEMISMYPYSSTSIMKDITSGYWVCMGGTGWANMWSVELGSLESGKYPV